jgi:hypothetical protein
MIVGKTIRPLTILAPQGNVVPTFGKLLQPRFADAATCPRIPHPPTCLARRGRLSQQFLESRKLFKLVRDNVFG